MHVAGNKSLQSRQMNGQNREQHFLCDPIVDVLSSTRIDIGEPCTSGGMRASGYFVVATA